MNSGVMVTTLDGVVEKDHPDKTGSRVTIV